MLSLHKKVCNLVSVPELWWQLKGEIMNKKFSFTWCRGLLDCCEPLHFLSVLVTIHANEQALSVLSRVCSKGAL